VVDEEPEVVDVEVLERSSVRSAASLCSGGGR
jgi:hypothetical protein